MGKTADLTAVQKAIIDTLKREGKTQKEISERIGCSQSAVSRHLSGKSVGRKKCGKKRCTTRRGDRTLRKIVEKDRFQTLGDLRKQWTESGVETSRATVHRRVLLNQKQRQKRLTWATEKQHWTVAQWSKVLFSDESKFCMSFGNQGARVWRKTGEKEMPKCLKSSVKYPQSVMVWGAMSAAGVGPLCFIKGRVNAASYQEILEHFMLPSAEKLYGDEDFVFQHDLAPAHMLLLCSPGQALLPLFLVQKHTPVHGGSGCFYSRLSPLLPQVPQGLESVLLHNLPQGPVTSSRCAAFFATLFPSHRLPTEVP
uniref:HTH cro/C1-type domain-containing protein n=1 Tax=Cyprinus carpio carpio TaxID=630221 RepID=A0A9J7XNB1_CYPCA